jgi:hypothetical protein
MRIAINLSPFVQLQRGGASPTASRAFFALAEQNALLIGRSDSQPSRPRLQPRLANVSPQIVEGDQDSAAISRRAAVYADAQQALERLRQQTLGSSIGADSDSLEAAIEKALSALNAPVTTSYRRLVTGQNHQQVSAVEVLELDPGASLKITGEITRAASAAQLRLEIGGPTSQVDATFRIRGSKGSSIVSVSAGDSAAEIAEAIQAAGVGVRAEVDGHGVNLTSAGLGSAAVVEFERLTASGHRIDGLNLSQVVDFAASSVVAETPHDIAGEFQAAASKAELTYTGVGGLVAGSVEFDLVGNLGSAPIELSEGESLATAAARINDESDETGVVAEASGNQLFLRSASAGAAASVEVQNLERTATTSVQGVNAGQIASFDVQDITPGSTHVFTGTIDRAADTAQLIYTGTAGRVVNTATFDVTGRLGAVSISITRDELLSAVAARVNAAAGNTGVTATVNGDQLIFEGTDVGSAEEISVELTNVEQIVSTSGVIGSQITAFQVNSVAANSTQNISGSITRNASQAELTYTGEFSNRIGSNATFTLTGSVGSAVVSVTFFQTLTSARDAINAKTAQTGVVAAVENNNLILRSSGVGSAATIAINVTSGSFATSGGDGNGTANGLNALATINGQALTGVGNNFTYSNAGGSYSFTAAPAFLGAINAITVTSVAGDFDVSGGNGDGTANGVDAQATINGNVLTAAGYDFTLVSAGDEFAFSAEPGFVGAIDAVTVESTFAAFDLSGGHGDGTANGADATAEINGQQLTSATRRFVFADAAGSYELEFADGFLGEFDSITVTPLSGTFTLEGGATAEEQYGVDAQGRLNSQTLTAAGGRFDISGVGAEMGLIVAAGFVGALAPITITSELVNADAVLVDALRSGLLSLAAFEQRLGDLTALDGTAAADAAASAKESVELNPDPAAEEETTISAANEGDSSTRGRIFSETFRRLSERDPVSSRTAATIATEQRRRLIDLLA